MRRTIHGARTKGGSVAKITNNTLIFGIMGGLAPMRNIKASTHVGYRVGDARMHQDIPLDPKRGLVYMMGQNPMGKYMLSRNPQCAGGIGRMASTSSSGAYTTPTRGKKVFIPPVAVLATSDSTTYDVYQLGSGSWDKVDANAIWTIAMAPTEACAEKPCGAGQACCPLTLLAVKLRAVNSSTINLYIIINPKSQDPNQFTEKDLYGTLPVGGGPGATAAACTQQWISNGGGLPPMSGGCGNKEDIVEFNGGYNGRSGALAFDNSCGSQQASCVLLSLSD